ncbi:MAG TPA: hypothetical protein VKU82_00175 [Planctomycetaceae bacterium]|nr:hypothetical protein [Planctomycetaceae bacterium]
MLFAILIGYPLSLGPAYSIFGPRFNLDLPSAYRPVARLYWRVPLVRSPMDKYMRLWGVRCRVRDFWGQLDFRGLIAAEDITNRR